MNVSRPYADVLPGPRGLVLSTLVSLERPVSVRALARYAGTSPQGTLRLVNELAAAGLVMAEPAGRALMVSLNREHLAAGPVIALVGLRRRLVEALHAELAGWPDLRAGWLFGSVARGDGGPASDVDILVVGTSTEGEGWAKATAALRGQVRRWTGNPLQLVEHTPPSFATLVKRSNPLVGALRREGIALTPGAEKLLRGAA